ncbi:MAG TPA: transglycosylase domain-containing protein [Solirubrobacterales bacterium]
MARRTRRRRRRSHKHHWKLLVAGGVLLVLLLAGGTVAATWAISVYNSAPPLSSLKPVQHGRSSAIFAADGSLIGFIRASTIRQPVPARALPQNLKDATVAIEDKGFFDHGAIDPASIARAAWKDLLAGGKPVQGASTITQQLVRNLYIRNPEETLQRKLKEIHLAFELEDAHSKHWILTQYLNTAPYGTVEGETAVGAEAAAQTYYGKPAKDLSLTEAALIAGLPQAPSEYNPFLDPKAALERRNEVLGAMEEQGYISHRRYRTAIHRGLGLNPGHKYQVIRDPFLFDLVQQELIDRYGINTVRYGGLKAYTTINPQLQELAQAAVDSCSVCYPEGGPASALASVDPSNGEIVALASTPGSAEESQFNYAWQAHRQPGSSFKTFVLTTAIKQGVDPYSTYYDGTSPKTLQIPGGGTWTVHNAEPGGGTMSLASATWDSVNAVFAQLDLDVGPENVTHTAHQMGITSPLESVPAEAIGGLRVGVTPLEMASAYATLADGGTRHRPTAIGRVEFPSGKVDEPNPDTGERVLSEGDAYEVTRLLEGVITQGTGAGYTSMGCSAAAGKTGTSEGLSDAWFVGYTPLFSTAVWVGHPQSREETGFGGPTAGPIWRYFMEQAVNGDCPEFGVPSSLPELSGLHSEHTSSSSSSKSGENEGEYGYEELEPEAGGREKGGNKASGNEPSAPPESSPAPESAPAPAPTPEPAPAPPPSPPAGVGGGVAAP